jgi:hypothetical protein
MATTPTTNFGWDKITPGTEPGTWGLILNQNLDDQDSDLKSEETARIAGDAAKINKAGDSMSGDLIMGANKITSTANPLTADTLTRKAYVDGLLTAYLALSGGTMSGNIDFNNLYKAINLVDPVAAQDAVTLTYLQTLIAGYLNKLSGGTIDGPIVMANTFSVKSTDDGASGSNTILRETMLPSGQQFGGRIWHPVTPIDIFPTGGVAAEISGSIYSVTGIPKQAKYVAFAAGPALSVGTTFDISVQMKNPNDATHWVFVERIAQHQFGSPTISLVYAATAPIFDISGGNARIKFHHYSVKNTGGTEQTKYCYVMAYSLA